MSELFGGRENSVIDDLVGQTGELPDLTRTIDAMVDQLIGVGGEVSRLAGEVDLLKTGLTEMISSLGETIRENNDGGWPKANRERFVRMLHGQRDLATASTVIVSELAPLFGAQRAAFYAMTNPSGNDEPVLALTAGYGYEECKPLSRSFRVGEGIVGQCAKEKASILLTDVPGDDVETNSGVGSSPPLDIIVFPVLFEGAVRAVVELASFSPFGARHLALLDQLAEIVAPVLNTIEAAAVTESLLLQSRTQAEELRSQQERLRESNADLERQTRLLAQRTLEAEHYNDEIERAKALVEEKTRQLAVSARYRSESIANMSHELRTPLNSLLILAEQLADDAEHTMSDAQLEYASVMLASGRDLLSLLDSILDLAKIESGTATVEMVDVSTRQLGHDLQREFDHVARGRGLRYVVDIAPTCPDDLVTDPRRLRQILKNLLANAFKFTERGEVHFQIGLADTGWRHDAALLEAAPSVIGFSVRDTGIGIEELQQLRIFEAFAQGDGSTARLYGGTGLGLSISRELVGLLGGEITLVSTPRAGSTFTVFLPAGRHISKSSASGPTDDPAQRPLTFAGASDGTARAAHPSRSTRRNDQGLDRRPFAGRKILVIDDDFRNVFAMNALLERGHALVSVAESGHDAIAILERTPDVDLVLTDIMMPGMDGYDTMRAIRAQERFQALPIIAVTGKVVPGERKRCLEAGANDYIAKPVDTDELITTIGRWLPIVPPTAHSPAR